MEQRHEVIVIGGGLAGLVAGISAAEQGSGVTLIEAHSVGGRASTTERNGFLHNLGAHALFSTGELATFLHRQGIRVEGKPPSLRTIRVLRDGHLFTLKNTPLGISRTSLLSRRDGVRLLRMFAGLGRLDSQQLVGISWAEYCSQYSHDIQGILNMLVRTNTYVNAPEAFDAGAAIAQIQAGLRGVLYLDGGWRTIVQSLEQRFLALGGRLRTGETVVSVESDGHVVVTTDRQRLVAAAVVVAGLSPDAVERLVARSVVGRERLGPAVYAACLDLSLCQPHSGVVLSADRPLYLSPHGPIANLAPVGRGLVSLLRYVPHDEVGGDPDVERSELRSLAALAGIDDDHIMHQRFLFRSIVAHGFPSAAGGGLAGRPTVDATEIPGVWVAGDWVGPKGLLADASAASARIAGLRAALSVSMLAHD